MKIILKLMLLIFSIALSLSGVKYVIMNYPRNFHTIWTSNPNLHPDSLQDPLANVTIRPTSSFHQYYPANCSAVFEGDIFEVVRIGAMLREIRSSNSGKLPIPSDEEIATNWVGNCSYFKHQRKYPSKPLSNEEDEFPIGYAIVTYKDAAQVERLLRAIYQPQNVYCIHTDQKSKPTFHTAIRKLAACFDNVFVASKLEKMQWGGISLVLADLHCMEDLLKHPVQWKYFLNLCGQDFPLKTNLEIVRQLKAYNEHNCIQGEHPHGRFRIRTRYKFHSNSLNEPPTLYSGRLQEKGPPPNNITIFKGDTYIAATRGFVDFLIHDNVPQHFLSWLNDTLIPDETFTPSLHRLSQAPGGYPKPSLECNVRFRKWEHDTILPQCRGKYARSLCIFSVGYLHFLQKRPELFVNKFHYDFDPVSMQCMEELLEHRTKHPEELSTLVHFPLTNFTWQNYTSSDYIPGLP